jgi:ribosomal protein S18 acetylase RimI-like enzyme
MEPAIREATARDYDDLCEIIDDVDTLHRNHLPHIFQEAAGPVRDREYILGLIQDEQVALLVAEARGQIVGFVHAFLSETPPIPILVLRRPATISDLAVRKDLRRLGIGRRLMEAVEQWAVARGASEIDLNVYEFNRAATAFYESLGYRTLSYRMEKPLREAKDG